MFLGVVLGRLVGRFDFPAKNGRLVLSVGTVCFVCVWCICICMVIKINTWRVLVWFWFGFGLVLDLFLVVWMLEYCFYDGEIEF